MPAHSASIVARWLGIVVLFATPTLADDGSSGPTRWYKGNTHAHSLWSDGDELPEMVADWYKSHGYNFLAISDHDLMMAGEKWAPKGNNHQVRLKTFDEVSAKLAEPNKFLLIPNEEISARLGEYRVHVNAMNLAEPIAPRLGRTVEETLSLNLAVVGEQATRLNRPILALVNHPDYKDYDISPEDLAAVRAARFFEVFNGGPVGHHFGDATHPGTEKLWDIVNTIRIAAMKAPPLFGIAADDAHHYQRFSPKDFNPGRGWIAVRAKRLSAPAILDALQRGDFYASTGVVLRDICYNAESRVIDVRVRPEPGVRHTIQFVGTLACADPTGEPVAVDPSAKLSRPGRRYSPAVGKVLMSVVADSAAYRLTGKELYVRAVVLSNKPMANPPAGNLNTETAWCQPVGWEK
jgi:hypothetical protein